VVKKIADEHSARLRVANLQADDAPDAAVTGARVSLSFSNFVATPPTVAARTIEPPSTEPPYDPAQPRGDAKQVH
jgi:hypothetical protein